MSVCVFVELADDVADVEPPSIVVEELGKVAILRGVRLVELLTIVIVQDVASLVDPVAPAADSVASLVD